MSEGLLRYILSSRFHNGLPEDCIAIALKQALLGLFDLHNSGLVHKCFSAGNIYVNFKPRPSSNVKIILGFAATIYDSELESPLYVSHGRELGIDSTVAILPRNPESRTMRVVQMGAAPEVFYSKCVVDLSLVQSPLFLYDDASTVHSDIWNDDHSIFQDVEYILQYWTLDMAKFGEQIKIKITSYEVEAGALLIPYIETFEYILRYWTLDLAKILVNGCGVCVQVWDVTADSAPKKYEGERVYLWKLCNDDYALSCIELFNSSRLGVGDEIGLFWDPRSSNFMFKLLSQVKGPTI
ncbi:hypothetical protein H5410_028578 [Solanum commersonii]|uniref:Protein kinase domain-containing protein n=1 Tax=Solanum commersonii TaxID=4109 RepID=A0A9J5Z7Y6_SOLCO|nr:hypothetical protein H5410_028578 [Solanum commersonii]